MENLPKNIVVFGKRWFDRVNGNTYHSTVTFVDGVEFLTEMEYGYGDHYLQSAVENLKMKGVIPQEVGHPYTIFFRENGVSFNYTVADVGRKRDL